ncbi:penicillin-binding protein [Sporanaerobium hydrogeniformans]|uniref:Penicillin-binding protein n=1 Tax=Sporanaerobium hydrogeniformans TaxID=3072179 RepID=A0AC61DD08_9FIRM|nr:PBP1A family penicillin-binding protein [Sporanaerobium hydrogeniformans]PHV70675.1 penicillin-binding protein [Sporanaerobium hydrogeniformans]
MNYSKDSREKLEKDNKKNPNKQKRTKGKILTFRILFMAIVIGLFAIVGGGLGIFIGIIKSTPDVSQLQLKPTTNFTSFVYDENNVEIDTFSGADNRIYVTLDKIPTYLRDAFIALEDERFYEHNGIDIRGIFRAIVKNLQSGTFSEGASTITQQLIKNNILTTEKKLTRKIQEQYLAVEFEKLYDKDMILEYYLNTIALGEGVKGVQAASQRYFGKDVSELTLAESAVIAVITQAPTRYNPIRNPQNNREKVEIALQKMYEQGMITEEQKNAALAEDPYKNIKEVDQIYQEKSGHSYFVDAVLQQVIDDLQAQKGMTSTEANNLIYGGGLSIYTTLDQRMQGIVDTYIEDESLYPQSAYQLKLSYSVSVKKAGEDKISNYGGEGIVKSEEDIESFKKDKLETWGITSADKIQKETLLRIPQPQAAFVVMDYRNGQVKALSGGRGDKAGRGFNRATAATRQPGSTFKILAAYAPALDTGVISANTLLIDEPITLQNPGGKPYSPRNWDGKFEGPTPIRRAIYKSMNVLAVKTTQLVGIDTAYDYLQNFGFTTLSANDKVQSLPLGGLTKGVTPLELNAAFGAIANDGMYVQPILYTKVLAHDGTVLLDNTSEAHAQKSHQVIKTDTAHILTDMMQDVMTQPEGTGRRLRSTFNSMPVAGKTGTTTNSVDLTFAGYTPYYVATIWTGHDTQKEIVANGSYHLDIWGKIMNEIHEGLPYKTFPKPNISDDSVMEVKLCKLSGKLATELCEADPDHVIESEYFTKDTVPTETCDIHVEVDVCKESGKIANEYCPKDILEKRIIKRDTTSQDPVIRGEICDIHGSVIDEPEEELPDDEGGWPTFPWPSPSPSPLPTPSPTPSPSLPPVVNPSPSPNPDDYDPFAVPQG